VFPEDGLFSPFGKTREQVRPFLEQIPDLVNATVNPCKRPDIYANQSQILFRMSCAASMNKIYISLDMGELKKCDTLDKNCPSDGFYHFNTAILFDDQGNLLVKYHKMNLFNEPYFDPAPQPELVFADTRFGRMGLFICFDMIFKLPGLELVEKYNVTTMLFNTWWLDELPFFSAAQYQQAWAITNNVNLLASNIHFPEVGSMGSGIYSGKRGQNIYSNHPDGRGKLLLADIPIIAEGSNTCKSNYSEIITSESNKIHGRKQSIKTNYQFLNMIMSNVSESLLTKPSDKIKICNNELCCSLEYSIDSEEFAKGEKYYFIVSNRTIRTPYKWCEEFCSIVRCDPDKNGNCQYFTIKDQITRFKDIKLEASFSTKYIYPNVVSNQLRLVERDKFKFFILNSDRAILEAESLNEALLTFGMYGRCYERD